MNITDLQSALREMPDAEFEQEFFINDEKSESRNKLMKCMYWAARNGRSITTFAKDAAE